MHQSYFQCRAARDASFSDKAVEICAVPGLGNIVGGENPRIGSFDNQGPAIDLCFSGSRVMRGGGGGQSKHELQFRSGHTDLHHL